MLITNEFSKFQGKLSIFRGGMTIIIRISSDYIKLNMKIRQFSALIEIDLCWFDVFFFRDLFIAVGYWSNLNFLNIYLDNAKAELFECVHVCVCWWRRDDKRMLPFISANSYENWIPIQWYSRRDYIWLFQRLIDYGPVDSSKLTSGGFNWIMQMRTNYQSIHLISNW